MDIRQAKPSDLDRIVPLALEFLEAAPISQQLPKSLTRKARDADVFKAFEGLLEREDVIVLVAEMQDERLVGFLAGQLGSLWFLPSVSIAQELAWWVSESARMTRAGSTLLSTWLDLPAVKEAACQIMSTLWEESPGVGSVLRTRGFIPFENGWVRGQRGPTAKE